MHHPVLLRMFEKLKQENEKLKQEKSELNDKQKQIAIELNEVNTRINNGQNEKIKERDENLEELEKTGGGLVIVRGRDGAATACHERFRTQEIMMEKYACASCASCVMMVMVMTMNCGGDDGVLLMLVL